MSSIIGLRNGLTAAAASAMRWCMATTTLALAPARYKLPQTVPLIVAEYLAFHSNLQMSALNHNSGKWGSPNLLLQPRHSIHFSSCLCGREM